MRSGPGLSYSTVGYLNKGDKVINLKQTHDQDGYSWRKVQVNGKICWVADHYLKSSTGISNSGTGNLGLETTKPPFMPNDPANYTLRPSDAIRITPDVLLSDILNTNVSTGSTGGTNGGYMEQIACENSTNTDDGVIAVNKIIDKSGNYGYVLYCENPTKSLAGRSIFADIEGNVSKNTIFMVFEREIGMVKIGGNYDTVDWSFSVLSGSAGFGLNPETKAGLSGGVQLFQLRGGGEIPLIEFNGYVVYVSAELNVGGVGAAVQKIGDTYKIGVTPGIGGNVYISVRKKNK